MFIKKELSSLIAWRYLMHKEKDSSVAFMIKICFAGIFIGTFALMLTLIITNGFEKTIHEKMRGINADVIVYSPGNKLDLISIEQALKTDLGGQIKGISGNTIKQAILDANNQQTVLMLKGIDPDREPAVTCLAEKIIRPFHKSIVDAHNSFSTILAPNKIIIGYKTAQEQQLKIGQKVTLQIPHPGGKRKIVLKNRTVTVAGIFKVGLEEYDHNVAFINLKSLNDFFDEEGVEQITISLRSDDLVTINKLKMRLPHLTVSSWKDLYPALVASLKLEKYVMFFILALITLVACMNMISLLFMQIQNKRRDIAIFKAMGMANKQIRGIFLKMGLTITMSASLLGLAVAALAGWLLERYPFIKLPDVYYVSHLPARMDAEIFLVVFIATLLLGLFATWLPAKRSEKIKIVDVLKQD